MYGIAFCEVVIVMDENPKKSEWLSLQSFGEIKTI